MTHQREVILDELGKFKGHPTADALYERIKKKLPRISLATVYRNLELLAETGKIKKLEISGRQKRFDHKLEQHDHVSCVQCQRVDNVRLDRSRLIPPETEDGGYKISGCRIEFFGICPECAEKNENKRRRRMKRNAEYASAEVPRRLSSRQREVLEFLSHCGSDTTSKDIAEGTALELKQISFQLISLRKKGLIASPIRCRYEITEHGNAVLSTSRQGENNG